MLNYYLNYLEIIILSSTIIGFFSGIINIYYNIKQIDKKQYIHQKLIKYNEQIGLYIFINIIGFTAIGFITGLFYPIIFPLLGLYIFL
jgi:uncharacterized membrane protein YidH (DUF202 family)